MKENMGKERNFPDASFWRGRRVLLTGHTGFKGAWLAYWLSELGARVTGFSLPPSTAPSLFDLLKLEVRCNSCIGDIRDPQSVQYVFSQAKPEVVFHLAAQALVLPSYGEPVETFSTNVMGTVHILDAIRSSSSVRAAVMVTTDKVYRNREWMLPYKEEDSLGGHDPYSASKAASEMAIESWRLAFLEKMGIAVASARAGNVIGGGDWSSTRLIPDMVTKWQHGESLKIRRPESVRPWQHVIEPLAGYLVLAERLWRQPELAGAYNFGPSLREICTVRQVIEIVQTISPDIRVEYEVDVQHPHEATLLLLDPSKSESLLGVDQRFSLSEAVKRSMKWYLAYYQGVDAQNLCLADIDAWMSAA